MSSAPESELKPKSKIIQIHTGSNVMNSPMYEPNTEQNLTYNRCANNNKFINVLGSICQESSIRDIYHGITDPDHGFVINGWCFLSANEIESREKNYEYKMVDIAVKYQGMGHVLVISYIPETDRFFFRQDGGSSYHDRERYYTKYSSDQFIPSKFPLFKKGTENQEFMQFDSHDMMQIVDPQWIFCDKNYSASEQKRRSMSTHCNDVSLSSLLLLFLLFLLVLLFFMN